MFNYLAKQGINLSKGITLKTVSSTKLFDANLGVLIIANSNSATILSSEKYYEKLKDITSTIIVEDIFQASFISLLEKIVAQDFLLLGGPYLLFSGNLSTPLDPKIEYTLEKVVNDYTLLDKYSDFSHAIQTNDKRDFVMYILKVNSEVAGVVTATCESDNVYSIGAEVVKKYQSHSIGSYLISVISNDLINQGKIVYYQASVNNIASFKMAMKANYDLIATTLYTV